MYGSETWTWNKAQHAKERVMESYLGSMWCDKMGGGGQ